MHERLTRPMLFGAYQLSLLIGILLLPVAVVAGRLGVTLPIHRVIQTLERAHERARDLP